ncbi:MAG: ORF6N domain-containing protein, partial [Nanoarchaeota archaeon]|nr:ORF6N domain-containing protein [Nanoarchaeota archaeon]
ISSANESIILIDNYVDYNTLTLFTERNEKVIVDIYTKKITRKLKLDLNKLNKQYSQINVKEFDKSHDRFLIIDKVVYHFGASLKDLGKKWFAFSKLDLDCLDLLKNIKL